MSIGQSLIKNELLSVKQARTVAHDLRLLSEKGIWNQPDWAKEVAEFLEVAETSLALQVVGWRAAARVLMLVGEGQ